MMRARFSCLLIAGACALQFAAIAGPSMAQSEPVPPALAAQAPLPAKNLEILYEGLAVFGSDGGRIGRVSKINLSGGKLRSIEVESKRSIGYFKKTYVVPASEIKSKAGKIELFLESDEIAQLERFDRL